MSDQLRNRLLAELEGIPLVDPHTHINPHAPAASSLADLLGYHYYTELAHSAGLPRERIEEPGLDPREKVRRLIECLPVLDNTIQVSWLVEMAQKLFGFPHDRITPANGDELFERAARAMAAPDWPQQVLQASRLEAVFLTNDFDDPLEGFDPRVYVPCLRTDDLVFKLADPAVRERLARATGVTVADARSLRDALGQTFEHFARHGARACAISLPPDFAPTRAGAQVGAKTLDLLSIGTGGTGLTDAEIQDRWAEFVFWTLAELCAEFGLPFDLMIGVNRRVYAGGVHQGQDLFDSRVSLIQYRELFNAFPQVKFPISVLASVTNQELVAYSWIFPNVFTSGHWWYSNTPTFIAQDAAARLEAVPRNKQIGYYSDMYKLEFSLPKFSMYRRILARILAERFVVDRGWSEDAAVALGRQVLRENVEAVFGECGARSAERGPN